MNKQKINSFFTDNWKLILIVLLHLLITIPLSYFLNTWYDEASTLITSSQTISYAVHRSIQFELQPPFYYIFLNVWRQADSSYFFARLLSIIFSSASIVISFILIKKYLKIEKPEYVTLLIAINPFLIYYATEIRPYTMLIFLSVTLIFLMYEIYLSDNKFIVARVLYILLSIISLHTQYYMGFILVGIGFSILIYGGWGKFRTYLIDMILPMLSLVAVIPFLPGINTLIEASSKVYKLNLTGLVEFFEVRITTYLFALNYLPLKFSRYEIWLLLFLIVLFFLFSIKERIKEFIRVISFKEQTTLPVTIIVLLFFSIIAVMTGRGMLALRHTAVLFPPLVFTFVSFIYLTRKKKTLIFWFCLISALYLTALINKFTPMAKEGDSIKVAKYLEANEENNELIFVPYNIIGWPLNVHYNGANTIVPLYDNLLSEQSRKKLLSEVNNKSEYAWWDCPYPDPTWDKILNQIIVSREFINNNYVILDKKYFKGIVLWQLKRKDNDTLKTQSHQSLMRTK